MQPQYRRDNVNILVDFSNSANGREEDLEGDTKRGFKIKLETMKLLGFDTEYARPAWMVIQTLLVPPPCVRPYAQFGSDRSEHDLTLKLLDTLNG
ncbi:DNA-directed RNA polymerase [Gregarina niphandrodes]|uniref:DNA-directed RNA polymerase n=1 Tax=Gregarina niphandrodes TaxID=110365 RepID=A0A023B5G3_GRENI|nr:DNA-directed RNA polymerase [Gregarina niphandrodes]EZG60854.1 DNA-directed RNA polymerase [Gregarina niphandrodes]|eukprot:XP_011130816.1 DNA-directed RNA polymerase [Gregarina niphandrodes]